MSKKRHTPEEIIRKLREAEVALAQGQTVVRVSRQLGITEQTFYRWRQEYGGLRLDQASARPTRPKSCGRLQAAVRGAAGGPRAGPVDDHPCCRRDHR